MLKNKNIVIPARYDCGEKHSIIFEKTEGEALKALLFLIIKINKLDQKST